MKAFTQTLLFCLMMGQVLAQTQKEPSLQDFQRQMLEMQRQMLQQFQQLSPGGSSGWDLDTTFSFQFDSLFGNQGMGQRFFFSPFGQDTSFMPDFGDEAPSMDGFNPFGGGIQWAFPPGFGFPENEENSALDDPGDGLLPEERLRKTPEDAAKPSEGQAVPEPKKPKIKTIRI